MSQISRCMDLVSIDVAHYMFCHYEHVQHRPGMPPLFRWQHLMAASGTELVVTFSSGHWNLVEVCSGGEQLERIEFAGGLELIVTVLDDWIAFRWTANRQVSQFQVRSNDVESIEMLAKKLEQASARVTWKPSFRDHVEARIDTSRLPFWEQIDTQMTQVEPQMVPINAASKNKLSSPIRLSQVETQPTQDGEATQCEEATQVELTQVESEHDQYSSTKQKPGHALYVEDDTRSETCSEISRLSSFNHSVSRLSVSRSELQSSIFSRRQRYPDINVQKLVKAGAILTLPIKALSYAMKAESPRGLVQWRHLGLASGLEINLLPSDRDGEPRISIMRSLFSLEAFAPDSRYIKVFASNDLLVFQQSGITNIQKERYIQLELEPKHIDAVCAWLMLWNVHVCDPEEPPETTATMTIDTNYRHETSSISRESRWWARQRISELPRI